MDIDRELREAEKTGEVVLGSKETTTAVRNGQAKLVVIAKNYLNSPKHNILKMAELSNVPVYPYDGDAKDLGLAFGKPFFVSIASITDPGESKIEELVGNE